MFVLAIIILITIVIGFIFKKNLIQLKNRSFSAWNAFRLRQTNPTSCSYNADPFEEVQKAVTAIRRVGQRVNKETEIFSQLQSYFTAETNFTKELHNRNCAIQAIVEEFSSKNDKRFEDTYQIIEILRNDIQLLKNSLVKFVGKRDNILVKEDAGAASSLQSLNLGEEDFEESSEQEMEAVSIILNHARKGIQRIIHEVKSKERANLGEILNYLEQNHQDVDEEMRKISAVAAIQNNREMSGVSVVASVEKLEKELLEAFIFLNNLRFQMDTIFKTLAYFNRKFEYVLSRAHSFWKQSNSKGAVVSRCIRDVEDKMSCSTCKIEECYSSLDEEVTRLKNSLGEVERVLALNGINLQYASTEDIPDSNIAYIRAIRTLDECCDKLDGLSSVLEKPRDQLYCFLEYSKNFKALHDLVKSTADGFDTLVNSLAIVESQKANLEDWEMLDGNEGGITPATASDAGDPLVHARGGGTSNVLQSGDLSKVIEMVDRIIGATRIPMDTGNSAETTKGSTNYVTSEVLRNFVGSGRTFLEMDESIAWEEDSADSLIDQSSSILVRKSSGSESS